jgi:hypothetical protein
VRMNFNKKMLLGMKIVRKTNDIRSQVLMCKDDVDLIIIIKNK